jgi:hypothetical protein
MKNGSSGKESPMCKVFFGGSRYLKAAPVVGQVVAAWLARGGSVVTGCATGADAQVIQVTLAAGQASRLSVFAAFAFGGAGACQFSAVAQVAAAGRAGARVVWSAGGKPSLPLVARLSLRSQAAVKGCGAVVLFHPGEGSLKLAALVAPAGVPVYCFPATFSPAPVFGVPGAWRPAVWCELPCLVWKNAQQPIL